MQEMVSTPPLRRYASENAFIDHVLGVCRENGVKVDFRPVRKLGRMAFTGEFDDKAKKLTVAVGRPAWIETLAHEFGHLEQMIEGLWIDTTPWLTFGQWLEGKKIQLQKVEKAVRTIQACEMDAEKRAIRYIRKYRMPSVNLERSIKAGNCYILMYEAALRVRKWPKQVLYQSKRVRAMMPSTFIRRFDRLPDGFIDRYLERC